MEINEIIDLARPAECIIADLKSKSVSVPAWTGKDGLVNQYDPRRHPVMNRALYPDRVNPDGTLERVTRITYDLQRLAVRRMSELMNGVPVKRVYKPENDRQKEVAAYLEKIFDNNRVDTVNTERSAMLFASCEVMTLWYAVEQPHNGYGFASPLKLRCRNFSPMAGDELWPLFDEYGDLVALSVGYRRKVGERLTDFFDAYTATRHCKWSNDGSGGWHLDEQEDISALGKIPAVYMYRPTPVWEDTGCLVEEMEWAMSRNGNYLRKNSKPLFVVFADKAIDYGGEDDEREGRAVLQYPQGSNAGYVTWAQAIDNLKFYLSELRQQFFTQLQLPDWSYESMKSSPMSGESRKQLFIDAQLKVADESGRFLEFYGREVNVVKAFLKVLLPGYGADIDALPVEVVITPFTISDEKDTIANLQNANGGKAVISQRESIERLGWSTDVDKTLAEIREEDAGETYGYGDLNTTDEE